jgi:hypothetical protein
MSVGLEIEGRHVALTILRWQKLTGGFAVYSTTGIAFDDLKEKEDCRG